MIELVYVCYLQNRLRRQAEELNDRFTATKDRRFVPVAPEAAALQRPRSTAKK